MQINIVPIKTWSFNRNTQRLLVWYFDSYTVKSQSTRYQVVYNIDVSGQWMFGTHRLHMVIYRVIQYRTRSNVNLKVKLLLVPL